MQLALLCLAPGCVPDPRPQEEPSSLAFVCSCFCKTDVFSFPFLTARFDCYLQLPKSENKSLLCYSLHK